MPEVGDTGKCLWCRGDIVYEQMATPHWYHEVGVLGKRYGLQCILTDKIATPRPTIVTLCGSTRFMNKFNEVNRLLSLSGKIVISVGFFGHSEPQLALDFGTEFDQSQIKADLDELHLRKIDLADEIFVVNVDGYIGTSTKNEIKYAVITHKLVKFLVDPPVNYISDLLKEVSG